MKCIVIAVPSKGNKSTLLAQLGDGQYHLTVQNGTILQRDNETLVPYHLYFLCDKEEIKSGDKVFAYEGIWEYRDAPQPMPYWANKEAAIKVVASTDSSLNLPLIPFQFIRDYSNSSKTEYEIITNATIKTEPLIDEETGDIVDCIERTPENEIIILNQF